MTQEQAQQAPTKPSSGHTPEPWYIDWVRRLRIRADAGSPWPAGSPWVIAEAAPYVVRSDGEVDDAPANARRIVACVNACAGLNPEAVPDVVDACQILVQEVEGCELDDAQQRAVRNARAALAAAKGGAA